MARKKDKKTRLEEQYDELFKLPVKQDDMTMPDTLEQPSPLRIVPSRATSAAAEEPLTVS